MAFKITATERKRIDEIMARITAKVDEVKGAVTQYNETVNEARGKVEDELRALNEIRDELHGVLEDIHRDREEEFDEKSDNWRDGDRGSATSEWLETISSSVDTLADEIEIEFPEDLEFDIDEEIETLENLPSEPEY